MRTMLEKFHSEPAIAQQQVENITRILNSAILTEGDWEAFKARFKQVHQNFFAELKLKYPSLSQAEVRLAALVKLNLFPREVASMLGISPESAHKARYRLRKKLELRADEDLNEAIQKISVSNRLAG